MGCALSKVDWEENAQSCKERKKLMKQLLCFRNEFTASQMAYLQALRNTGVTLRQFAEVESKEFNNVTSPFVALPPSPPPLPPSPPPPPTLSPHIRSSSYSTLTSEYTKSIAGREENKNDQKEKHCHENIEIYKDDETPPPPPSQGSTWGFWDPFEVSSPPQQTTITEEHKSNGNQGGKEEEAVTEEQKMNGNVTIVEDENWAETNTEFEEEQEVDVVSKFLPEKSPAGEMDDNSSMSSWFTKDTDLAMVVWRTKKSLAAIMKDLDDYFLKASAGGKEITILLESNRGGYLHSGFGETKGKISKSAKVFSALSWSWSSKSLQSSRDAFEFHGTGEAFRPGGHCTTLDKLYTEEQRLYGEFKEERVAKLHHEKMTLLLQRQEARNQDWMKQEKTRSTIENLQAQIGSLQQSIDQTSSGILKLRDEELYPQLVELSAGLVQMWRTMYECHQVQNHIAQQLNHLSIYANSEPTTSYHHQAAAQLETEVTAWYNTFCNLLKSQRDYIHTLTRWVQLTQCLSQGQPIDSLSGIHALCEEWQLALDRLPDKVASEAIKSFVAVVHSIVLQQSEELNREKKSNRLEKRLDKELKSLSLMERKFARNFGFSDGNSSIDPFSGLSPKHKLSVKRAKTDSFKRKVEEEKSKYLNSVEVSRAMTLNNLQTGLPNVFQALMGFSSVCMQAFEGVHGHAKVFYGEHRPQFCQ